MGKVQVGLDFRESDDYHRNVENEHELYRRQHDQRLPPPWPQAQAKSTPRVGPTGLTRRIPMIPAQGKLTRTHGNEPRLPVTKEAARIDVICGAAAWPPLDAVAGTGSVIIGVLHAA
ncbi:MAG TPA: hypothetical protein VF070_16915 [Streptosporangiaceae bacterium]